MLNQLRSIARIGIATHEQHLTLPYCSLRARSSITALHRSTARVPDVPVAALALTQLVHALSELVNSVTAATSDSVRNTSAVTLSFRLYAVATAAAKAATAAATTATTASTVITCSRAAVLHGTSAVDQLVRVLQLRRWPPREPHQRAASLYSTFASCMRASTTAIAAAARCCCYRAAAVATTAAAI
jgi:hypothetical protein